MEQIQAKSLINDLFTKSFNLDNYQMFLVELLGTLDEDSGFNYISGKFIAEKYHNRIASYKRIAKYIDSNDKKVDLLVVNLKEECNLERHRSSLRNFIMEHLNKTATRDAAIVAFVAHDKKRWRLSLVCLETALKITDKGNLKTTEKATPAKRYSFLLGETEPSHTAQQQFLPLLIENKYNPSLEQLEKIFAVEKLSDAFFNEYVQLLDETKHAILDAAKQDSHYQLNEEIIKNKKSSYSKYYLTTADGKAIDVGNFAKKLLGQIVFLYFLQKKGWLGVAKDKSWGTGNKAFMRYIFNKHAPQANNYFNQFLEPLFYGALASERADDYFDLLDCKIPFLNGGLFEAYSGYDRVNHGLKLPNNLFSNDDKIKATKNSIEMTGTGILDVFDRYNFTVCEDEPLEKEVAIDPEMLGKIFENTIEDNERKGKGAFYTPRPIVHYMVKQSLIEYLASHLDDINDIQKPDLFNDTITAPDPAILATSSVIPAQNLVIPAQAGIHQATGILVTRDDLQLLVNQAEFYLEHETRTYDKVQTSGKETEAYSHKIPKTIIPAAARIDKLLADVLILDPAVGSGAFPVGLLTELVKVRQLLQVYIYPSISELTSSVIPLQAGINRQPLTTYQLKYHAIANSIYGVDIDSGAIDVARLRLWLSLVVDEEDNNQQIQPLPNLDYKLVCGNSLTRINQHDMFIDEKINRLTDLEQKFIDESRIKHKQNLKTEIDQLLADIMHDGFDFRYVFGKYRDGDGFDIVIGNPPYGTVFDSVIKKIYTGTFDSFKRNNDLYIAFYEQGMNILKDRGTLTYITPNTFMNGDYFKTFRKIFTHNMQILEILDFNKVKVFDDPTVFVCVLSALKNVNTTYPYQYTIKKINSSVDDFDSYKIAITSSSEEEFKQTNNILNKIESNKDVEAMEHFFYVKDVGFNYWTVGKGKVRDGNSIGNRVFYRDTKQDIQDIPFLKGSNIFRYYYNQPNNYLKHDYINYLNDGDVFRFSEDFLHTSPKIIYRQTSGKIIATIDYDSNYLDKTAHMIVPNDVGKCFDLKYILALLNSQLFDYLYRYLSNEDEGRVFSQVKATYVKKFPVKIVSTLGQMPVINLVDEILAITSQDSYLINEESQKQVLLYQKQIDQLVYQLYDLTPDEISLIEGK